MIEMAMRDAFRRAGLDVPDAMRGDEDMTTRTCASCGRAFTPDQPFYTRCSDCESERRRASGDQRRGGQPKGQRQGPQRESSKQPVLPRFPKSYFVTDDDGNRCLSVEFVSKAQVDPLAQVLARRGLTTGQMRRFFNNCRQIEHRLKIGEETWSQVAADFDSLSYHAQYAQASGRNFPREFQSFIDDNVKRVNDDNNPREAFLRGFMQHFEALVGFGAKHM